MTTESTEELPPPGATIAVVAETVQGNRVLWMTEQQAIALCRLVGDAVWGE